MNCDTLRNRLLTDPLPSRVPAEARPHLAQCAACREYLARFEALAKNIQALPVPSSELAKIAYIDSLNHAGPIIRTVPSTPGSVSWKRIMHRVSKPLLGTAAAVAVGLGIWSMSGSKKPVAPEMAAPRHDLLKKVVATNATLAKTNDPRTRIATLTDLAADIRVETADVMKAAKEEDMVSLANMFEKIVTDGLVKQAKDLNPLKLSPKDRLEILDPAALRLTAIADDANALARNAPPYAKESLGRIEKAAKQGSVKLRSIAAGEGV